MTPPSEPNSASIPRLSMPQNGTPPQAPSTPDAATPGAPPQGASPPPDASTPGASPPQSASPRTASSRRWRLPRRTVRLKFTLLYGGLFLASGAALLAVTYVLVEHRIPVVATTQGQTSTGVSFAQVCAKNPAGGGATPLPPSPCP